MLGNYTYGPLQQLLAPLLPHGSPLYAQVDGGGGGGGGVVGPAVVLGASVVGGGGGVGPTGGGTSLQENLVDSVTVCASFVTVLCLVSNT